MPSYDGTSLTRRAALRLVIWGAAGLSFLPGCLRRFGGADDAPQPMCYSQVAPSDSGPASLLGRWARLGEIWREMSRHMRGDDGGPGGRDGLKRLREGMAAALDGVDASPELRLAFERRWAHIDLSAYPEVTCYKMAYPHPSYDAVVSIEKQVEELEDLVSEGKLTQEAATKAARVFAVDVEVLLEVDEAPDDWDARHELIKKLDADYKADELEPREGAVGAGQRMTEMTADRPGLLSGLHRRGGDPPVPTCYDVALPEPSHGDH